MRHAELSHFTLQNTETEPRREDSDQTQEMQASRPNRPDLLGCVQIQIDAKGLEIARGEKTLLADIG